MCVEIGKLRIMVDLSRLNEKNYLKSLVLDQPASVRLQLYRKVYLAG